jgi:hypothetical protein
MNSTARNIQREANMCELYADGSTLDEIGALYGITRERVRQLVGRHGFNGKHGGKRIRGAKRKAEREEQSAAARDARCAAMFGCDYATVVALNEGLTPWNKGALSKKYSMQRRNAIRRSIPWQFNYPEWHQVWVDSGHLSERGRGDGYVMGRNNDDGPYVFWNVHICTSSENIKEGYVFRARRKSAA